MTETRSIPFKQAAAHVHVN